MFDMLTVARQTGRRRRRPRLGRSYRQGHPRRPRNTATTSPPTSSSPASSRSGPRSRPRSLRSSCGSSSGSSAPASPWPPPPSRPSSACCGWSAQRDRPGVLDNGGSVTCPPAGFPRVLEPSPRNRLAGGRRFARAESPGIDRGGREQSGERRHVAGGAAADQDRPRQAHEATPFLRNAGRGFHPAGRGGPAPAGSLACIRTRMLSMWTHFFEARDDSGVPANRLQVYVRPVHADLVPAGLDGISGSAPHSVCHRSRRSEGISTPDAFRFVVSFRPGT